MRSTSFLTDAWLASARIALASTVSAFSATSFSPEACSAAQTKSSALSPGATGAFAHAASSFFAVQPNSLPWTSSAGTGLANLRTSFIDHPSLCLYFTSCRARVSAFLSLNQSWIAFFSPLPQPLSPLTVSTNLSSWVPVLRAEGTAARAAFLVASSPLAAASARTKIAVSGLGALPDVSISTVLATTFSPSFWSRRRTLFAFSAVSFFSET